MQSFQTFYQDTIYAKLIRLERIRWAILLFFGISFLVVPYLIFFEEAVDWLHGLLYIFFLFVWYVSLKEVSKSFGLRGKRYLMAEVIRYASVNSVYYPMERLSNDQIQLSSFFPDVWIEMEGEDLLLHKTDEVSYDMCELKIWREDSIRGGVDLFFSGRLITFVCDHPFDGSIMAWPKSRAKSMELSAKSFFRLGAKPVSKYDSKTHLFYSVDTTASRNFPFALLESFFESNDSFEQPLYMSVKNNVIFLALESKEDQFEVRVLKGVTYHELERLHQQIRQIDQLVVSIHQILNQML